MILAFSMSACLITLIFAILGQFAHQLLKIQNYIRDPNKPDFQLSTSSLKLYFRSTKWLILTNLGLILLVAVFNGLYLFLATPILMVVAGGTIDSVMENLLGQNLSIDINKLK